MAPRGVDRSTQSDVELVAACRRGDGRAWRVLVSRYRRLVYGIPRSLGLQPADADEVFQRTFTQLLRALPQLRDASRLEPWLATTARRASWRLGAGERRRAQRLSGAASELNPGTAPAADASLERLRERERVRRTVESLGEPCRALLLGLFSDPPQPYRLLARELGFAVGSVGVFRARCLERLRRRLLRERGARELSAGGDA